MTESTGHPILELDAVTLRFGGRSVRVPVVDRGPYVAGREFDLTEATKQALGFGDTGDVWSTR